MSPLCILFDGSQCLPLVEIMSNQETNIDTSFENHLVDVVENLCCIDSLSEIGHLFLLLLIQFVKQAK